MKTSIPRVIARSLLGVLFVAGPLATAFHLAPEPSAPPAAASFLGALKDSGYMLPLLWITEITAGVLLLSGIMVPLGLVILAPVLVNIAAFHAFLAPAASLPAIVACSLEVFLTWEYRRAFAPLFRLSAPRQALSSSEKDMRAA